MTKKMTMEEVAQYVINAGPIEYGEDELLCYLWTNDQGQTDTLLNSTETFSAVLDKKAYVDYPEKADLWDEVGTLDNKFFREVVEEIYNEYEDWYENYRGKTADDWKEILEDLDDDELIDVWNDYTEQNNDPDSYIFYMGEIDDIFPCSSASDIINTLATGFSSHHRYFQFNGYGHLESFNDLSDHVYISDIVRAIVDGYYDPSNVKHLF